LNWEKNGLELHTKLRNKKQLLRRRDSGGGQGNKWNGEKKRRGKTLTGR
jgi:hypothetical protein